MKRNQSIVYCITCKGRTPHVMQTLPQNLADNPKARFVLLNYNSGDGLVEYILLNHQTEIQTGRLVLYSTFDPDRFQMAHAKNLAHRLGIREGGDVLVNLDADNFTGPGFDEWLLEQFPAGVDHFAWAQMVKTGPDRLDRGITGRIAVTRNAFLMTGGYDEIHQDWGPDDEDFKQRLRMLSISESVIPAQFLRAVRHTDKLRFREYPHVEPSAYDSPSLARPSVAVVNSGNVGCGKVFRNESGRPIWIAPIPTRVFGIGMHKTGTSSLHAAFRVLGFNSAHWNTALWARQVWEEVKAYGRSETLERHYAFSDLPFPLLYKELDKAYPGSKFVLTVRNADDWLRSVRDHWDPNINPYRADWDIAPFTHKIHHLLYGRKTFDPVTFIERYGRHNAEVLEYFRDRPADLLVLDVPSDMQWGPLCAFLERPVPAVPFPHKLRTSAYAAVNNYEI